MWCCKEVVALLRELLCQGLEDVWGWVPLKERGLGWGTRGLSMTTVGNDELMGTSCLIPGEAAGPPWTAQKLGSEPWARTAALSLLMRPLLLCSGVSSLRRALFRAGLLPAVSVCASLLSSDDPMLCGLSALSSGESVPSFPAHFDRELVLSVYYTSFCNFGTKMLVFLWV